MAVHDYAPVLTLMTFLEPLNQKCVVSWKDKTEDAYQFVAFDEQHRMVKLAMILVGDEKKVFWASLSDIAGIGLESEDSRYAGVAVVGENGEMTRVT